MSKGTKKENKTTEEIMNEIRELSNRANETSSKQLEFQLGDEDIDPVISSDMFKDTADPEKSHRFYYGIQRLLRDNLPKGDSNKRLREYVYNEKNLFLNRGIEINEQTGTRGSDSRMTYIPNFLEVAFNEVGKWIGDRANPFDIYKAFWDLNEARGYHSEKKA